MALNSGREDAAERVDRLPSVCSDRRAGGAAWRGALLLMVRRLRSEKTMVKSVNSDGTGASIKVLPTKLLPLRPLTGPIL